MNKSKSKAKDPTNLTSGKFEQSTIAKINDLVAPERFLELLKQRFKDQEPEYYSEAEKQAFEVQVYRDFLLDHHNMPKMNQDINFQTLPTKGKKGKKGKKGPHSQRVKYKSLLKNSHQQNVSKVFTEFQNEVNQPQEPAQGQPVQDNQTLIFQFGIKLDGIGPKEDYLHKYFFLGYELTVDRGQKNVSLQFGYHLKWEEQQFSQLMSGIKKTQKVYLKDTPLNVIPMSRVPTEWYRFFELNGNAQQKMNAEAEPFEEWTDNQTQSHVKISPDNQNEQNEEDEHEAFGKRTELRFRNNRWDYFYVRMHPAGYLVHRRWCDPESEPDWKLHHLKIDFDTQGKVVDVWTAIEE